MPIELMTNSNKWRVFVPEPRRNGGRKVASVVALVMAVFAIVIIVLAIGGGV